MVALEPMLESFIGPTETSAHSHPDNQAKQIGDAAVLKGSASLRRRLPMFLVRRCGWRTGKGFCLVRTHQLEDPKGKRAEGEKRNQEEDDFVAAFHSALN
jgi:hypothetical protein